MIKSRELTDPNSCMSRANADEPTFVLLGRDTAAPMAIRAWVDERLEQGKNEESDPQIQEALGAVALFVEYRAKLEREKRMAEAGVTEQDLIDTMPPKRPAEH